MFGGRFFVSSNPRSVYFIGPAGTVSVCVSFSFPTNTVGCKREFVLHEGSTITVAKGGTIRIDVTDSGAGMTAEQVENVFKEGTQFNRNQLQAGQGSGLGCYIAYSIAIQHEGNLMVASRGLDQGTAFTFTLPMFRVPQHIRSIDRSHHSARLEDDSVSSVDSKPNIYRILVVDDVDMNRRLLMRMLRNKGHECEEANDGDVAVEKIKESLEFGNPYNCILLDYEMPRMIGPVAAKEIRKLGCDAIIVGVTGNTLSDDVDFFKSQGANAVLPKPVNLSDLEEAWAAGTGRSGGIGLSTVSGGKRS